MGRIYGGLSFGILIGMHICGAYIRRDLYTEGVLTGFYGMLSVEIMNSVFSKHKTRVFTRKSCVGIKTRILSKTFKICDNPFENC